MTTKGKTTTERLLVFHTECVYLRGGEKYIYEHIKYASKRRPVILFVEKISPYWEKIYFDLRVPVFLLWKPKKFYWALLPITLFVNFLRLRNTIQKGDVIFASIFPLTFLSVLLSKRTIVFCFEPLNIFYDKVFIRNLPTRSQHIVRLLKFLYRPLDSYAIYNGGALATLNLDVKRAVKNQYGKLARFLIPNGVDTSFFTPKATPLFSFKRRGRTVIGHSTDYTPLKGTEYLLRALPSVIRNNKSVIVLISETISNPQKKKEYQQLIKSLRIQQHVFFVGTIEQKDLPGFYTSCHIFCFCGSSFCVGAFTASLSVIEAQSCGLPVLRTAGNRGEIKINKTGYFIYPEQTFSFSKKILLVTRFSKSKLRAMQKHCRQHAKSFDWGLSAGALHKAIQFISRQKK